MHPAYWHYSICQTLCSWHGPASRPAVLTENSRKLALPVRLQHFSTSPAQHWNKAKVKVLKVHNKIANIRKDFVHKSSNDLSKNHVVVLVEDLCIRNMSKSGRGSQENQGKIVEQKSGLFQSCFSLIFSARSYSSYRCVGADLTWLHFDGIWQVHGTLF